MSDAAMDCVDFFLGISVLGAYKFAPCPTISLATAGYGLRHNLESVSFRLSKREWVCISEIVELHVTKASGYALVSEFWGHSRDFGALGTIVQYQ